MPKETLYGYRLREHQARLVNYTGGRVGVAAVPGSGKTLTLALLAARLIIEQRVGDGEVLIVTVQNAAVENITQRVREILRAQDLPPLGFRVCTLHKLASDILRERYDLAGTESGFSIVDEIESQRTMESAAAAWIDEHREWWEAHLPETNERQRAADRERWQEETERVGREVTALCKQLRLSPKEARRLLRTAAEPGEFLPMGIDLYARYARYLSTRSGLDFDDLIWRAIEALEQDPSFLANLSVRWPYILEDEAQDSSPLQELILERLAGSSGNWVRVGDPNQAINSTFTPADPGFFRRFLQRSDVRLLTLVESGRSARPIQHLANQLVHWACARHPEPRVRRTAFHEQEIRPTEPGDAQPNPPSGDSHVHLHPRPFADTDAETKTIATWAASYAERYPERTLAVLCPARWHGTRVIEWLETFNPDVPYDDLLYSTPRTRSVAGVLAAACDYIGNMTSSRKLSVLYATLAGDGYLNKRETRKQIREQRAVLYSVQAQDLLFPRDGESLSDLLPAGVDVEMERAGDLEQFAGMVRRWVRASALTVDQLILTIANDLFRGEDDLAICHSLATSLRTIAGMHPNWRLPEIAEELRQIAENRRGFAGLSTIEAHYRPRPGRVVVTTLHKAKGLEWDAVYMICTDSLEFPDTLGDTFRDESGCMPGRAPALEASTRLARLATKHLSAPRAFGGGTATTADGPHHGQSALEAARLEFIAERLRLLYVGITRARRDLAITWSARNGSRPVHEAGALGALRRLQAQVEVPEAAREAAQEIA